MGRRWRRWLGVSLATIYVCVFLHLSPLLAQSGSGSSSAGSCPPGYIPYYPGVSNVCIPNVPQMTIPQIFAGATLPADVIGILYQTFGINRPVPPGGGRIDEVLPLAVLGHDGSAGTPGLNTYGIQANIGEIIQGAGYNPNGLLASQIPFFANYVPNMTFGEFILEAYTYATNNSFRNMRVDDVEPIREEIIRRVGEEAYRESKIAENGVTLASLPAYVSGGGGSGGAASPAMGQALMQIGTALAQQAGTKLLNYGIQAAQQGLGLVGNIPGNFNFSAETILKDLFGLNIPLSKIKQILEFPIPIPVRLNNTGVGNIMQTVQKGAVFLNALSGFICGDAGKSGTVVSDEFDQKSGQDARVSLPGMEVSKPNPNAPEGTKEMNFRLAGGNVKCGDKSASGFLGAITQFQGYQAIKAWEFDTELAKITLQLSININLDGINYEGRMKMCFTKKPWKDILGCSANAALPGGVRLPPISLGSIGLIFVPLKDLIGSLLPALNFNPENIVTMLAYSLQFVGAPQLAGIVQQVAPHLMQFMNQAQERASQGPVLIYDMNATGSPRAMNEQQEWWRIWETRRFPRTAIYHFG